MPQSLKHQDLNHTSTPEYKWVFLAVPDIVGRWQRRSYPCLRAVHGALALSVVLEPEWLAAAPGGSARMVGIWVIASPGCFPKCGSCRRMAYSVWRTS